MKSDRQTFIGLDGLRGVAAIIIVIFHLQVLRRAGSMIFASGGMAVDLFFIISGFVIAHAYETRLRHGLTFARFAEIRALRLYPLYLLSLVIGIGVSKGNYAATGDAWLLREQWFSAPFAILALPRPSRSFGFWFTINPPSWSLFFEWVYNLVYVAILPWLTTRRLAGLVAAAALLVVVRMASLGGFGAEHQGGDILLSAIRPVFGFAAGILMFRIWQQGGLPAARVPSWVAIMMFGFAAMLPQHGLGTVLAIALAMVVLMPVIVALGVTSAPAGRSARIMTHLGALSYPLYTLHYPIMLGVRACGDAAGVPPWVVDLAILPIALLASSLALRYYDESVRRTVAGWLKVRRSDVEAARPL